MKQKNLTLNDVVTGLEDIISNADAEIQKAIDLGSNIEDSDMESSYEVTKLYAMRVHLNQARRELEQAFNNRTALENRLKEKEATADGNND